MAALRAILVICAIPLLGFIAYWSILWHALGQPNFTAPLRLTFVCEFLPRSHSVFTPELVSACEQIWPIDWLGIGSVASLLLGLIVPALFWGVAAIVGTNRSLLASVFPPLTFVAILLVAVLFLINAGILVAGVYHLEAYWAGRVHFFLVGGVGAACFIGAIAVSTAAFRMFRPATATVLATIATSASFPKLHGLIASVAGRISARLPDNVILGLQDDFFATSAKVGIISSDQQLSGETLCLSLPMLRVLSTGELSAVIAHELGHFSGSDTAYSLQFAPVYKGLIEAAALVDSGSDVGPNFAGKPAQVILESMLKAFSKNATKASRDREFEADRIGAQATSAEDLSFALIKISALVHLWANEAQLAATRLQQRRVARNLAQDLAEQAYYEAISANFAPNLDGLLDERITHPTDTHPSTRTRIEAVGLDADSLLAPEKTRDRFSFLDAACRHLDEMDSVEEQLTELRHQIYVAHGISIPDQQEWGIAIADLTAAFLAHFLRAGGHYTYADVYALEEVAVGYLPLFDRAYFRECCRPKTELPDADQLLRALAMKLTGDQRTRVLHLLAEISKGDEAVSSDKARLIRNAEAAIPATV